MNCPVAGLSSGVQIDPITSEASPQTYEHVSLGIC